MNLLFLRPQTSARDGDELEIHYRHTLEELGKEPGLIEVIFRKAQNKIQDPITCIGLQRATRLRQSILQQAVTGISGLK